MRQDGLVKSLKTRIFVIPVKTGIQFFQVVKLPLDTRLRGYDDFLRDRQTGFEKNVVGKYLSVLTDLKIIRREVPVTEKSYEKSKKGIYMLSDNYFRFWFKFVFPNRSFIEEGDTEYVIKNKIKPELDRFVSQTYEEVCWSYIKKGIQKDLKFNQVGRW